MIAVQVGDEVVITRGFLCNEYSMGRVLRVTPKGQVVLENGERYMHDGWRIGGGGHIENATDEARARVRRQELQRGLQKTLGRAQGKVHSMDLDQLERLDVALARGLDG